MLKKTSLVITYMLLGSLKNNNKNKNTNNNISQIIQVLIKLGGIYPFRSIMIMTMIRSTQRKQKDWSLSLNLKIIIKDYYHRNTNNIYFNLR